MVTPRALVVRTAGTNTDVETVSACVKVGFETELLHVNRLVAAPRELERFHLLVFPGGFSYGDDLGSGRVLANEIRLKLARPVVEFIGAGRLVLGICNGFQVLVKANLLPDPAAAFQAGGGALPPQRRVTLTFNDSGRFEDRWVRLKVVSPRSPFFPEEGWTFETAVNHGEGRFVTDSPATLDELKRAGQVVLRYVDPEGRVAGYPWNPNGSTEGIAALCDPSGRVLGLMPHPEKHQDPTNHPQWTRRGPREPEGLVVFANALSYARKNL